MAKDSKNKEKKTKDSSSWLLAVLVLIIGVGGFLVYDKVIKNDKFDVNQAESNQDTSNNLEDGDETAEVQEIEIDGKKIDPELENYLLPLTYAFGEIDANTVTYSQDLLDDSAKFKFAWGVANLEEIGTSIKEDEVDYELGNYYVNYDSFKNLYKRLFGIEFDGTIPSNETSFVKKDNNLYGVIFTEYTVPDTTYVTLNKVLNQDNIYNLTIDIYEKETMTKKDCQLQMVVEKVNNDYQFKSVKLVK